MNASSNKVKFMSGLAMLTAGLLGAGSSWAVLDPASTLSVDAGSFFTMGGSTSVAAPGFDGQNITGLNGIVLGTLQPATGSHSGAITGAENADVDNPWLFFNNTGMHGTEGTAPTIISAAGNTATLDFSGWRVSWNGVESPGISMGVGAWYAGTSDGVANVECAVDCAPGDTYTLTYSATVPDDGSTNFGNVQYLLRLTGTISGQAPVANDLILPVLANTPYTWTPDVSGDPTTCDGTQPPGGEGTVTFDASCGASTYDPGVFAGTTSFTYWADNASGTSNVATVTVEVSATPRPFSVDDTASTRVNTSVDIDVTANDTDADDNIDPTTITIVSDVSNGVTAVNGGLVTYTPDAAFTGSDSFTYTVDDADGGTSEEATVTITVAANVAPVAQGDTATTNADTPVQINVLANDSDPDGGMLDPTSVVATQPSNGSTAVNPNGRVTYTPDAGFAGLDSFTYTVDDNDGGVSNSATVNVTVLSGGASGMPANATLTIEAGSNFTMEVQPGEHIPTAVTGFQGLKTFVAQTARGSHSGVPNGSETPGIDNPWNFFGNTGMHGTSRPARVLSAAGNTATLDMSGWFVTWNGITQIPMGSRPWGGNAEGVANIVCSVDCSDGDSYTLTYTATVPAGDPSSFGNVAYGLNLRGTVRVIAPVEAAGSTGTPVVGPGSEGGSASTGYQIALSDLPADSAFEAVGAVFDFSVSGIGVGGTAVVTLNLGQALPSNAVYRKYMASTGWTTFSTSGGNVIESGVSVAGECTVAAGVTYSAGLIAGNDCMRLTIIDGGSNDGDGAADGTVFDPGVVAVASAAPSADERTSGSSGCTIGGGSASVAQAGDWLLIVLTFAGLAWLRRRTT